MERLTKIAITLWACAAVALQVWLLHYSWRQLPLLALVAVLSMAVLSSFDRRAVALVLATVYVFPVLVRYTRGLQSTLYGVLWMAAILGIMLPDLLRTPWHLPRRWRVPLVFTLAAIAVSALIVGVREVDGLADLLIDPDAAYWRGTTAFTLVWVLHVALTLVIGVLLFDWLWGAVSIDFERVVVTPLLAGAFVMSLAVVYQVAVDPRFLNETVFYVIGRATGTTYDANVAGVVAAIWLGGTWLWAMRQRGWRLAFAPLATAALLTGVWGSGSRTALVCAAGTAAGIGVSLLFKDGVFRKRPAVAAAVVIVLAAGVLAPFGAVDPAGNNPVARFRRMLVTYPSREALLGELWQRNGYGTVATYMIRQSPLAGVGVGAYHGLVTEMGATTFGYRLPPDNAQNWLRHQIAELGFVGGAGWMLWFVAFAAFVCVPRRGEPDSIWIARGILVAFGLISLVGMPGQDPMVAVTFWVFAVWYMRLRGVPAEAAPIPPWAWTSMAAALVVFAAASVVVAGTWLRLPNRALAARQPFSYGYAPIIGAGPDTGYRGVNTRAVTVVEPDGRWLAVTVRLAAPAMSSQPVDVRVWKNGEVVLKAQLTTTTPFNAFAPAGDAGTPLLLETSARPPGTPRWWPFTADSGVLMRWEFVEHAPTHLGYQPE